MISTTQWLRRIAEQARNGEPLGDDGKRLADAIELWLATVNTGCTFEQALGIANERGGEGWWSKDHRAARDEAIREFFVRYTTGEFAQRLATLQSEFSFYERRLWPADRLLPTMPDAYRGTPRELLHRAFRANESRQLAKPMPLSNDQLRRILASCCVADEILPHDPPGVDAENEFGAKAESKQKRSFRRCF